MKSRPADKPRHTVKLLSPEIQRRVVHWRFCCGFTFARIRAEVLNQFGIHTSIASLWRLLRKGMFRPAKPKSRFTTFDAVLESAAPIRVTVTNGRAKLFVVKPESKQNAASARSHMN